MKKVWIEPGCIACGACQFNAPEVFEVTDRSRIINSADLTNQSAEIKKAAQACPVSVIKYED